MGLKALSPGHLVIQTSSTKFQSMCFTMKIGKRLCSNKTNGPFPDAACLNMLCTIALLKHKQIPSDISFGIYFRKPKLLNLVTFKLKKYREN